jgi:hypothetical protein
MVSHRAVGFQARAGGEDRQRYRCVGEAYSPSDQ